MSTARGTALAGQTEDSAAAYELYTFKKGLATSERGVATRRRRAPEGLCMQSEMNRRATVAGPRYS